MNNEVARSAIACPIAIEAVAAGEGTLRTAIASKVINTIRGGGVIFSYYPDEEWLQTSKFLTGCESDLSAAD